jgi:DNA helicase-2/ATP-dependent DNA helicase PcrA
MLNSDQQRAVKITEGPVRIIAGAGTGKTHTLISRISFLIKEKNVQPDKILALTFTSKAAHELNERLLEKNMPTVNAMTFHALATGLIRKYGNSDFSICARKEQEEILKEILNPTEIDDIKNIISALDEMRQNGLVPDTSSMFSEMTISDTRLREILKKYLSVLEEKNAIDFTGLLVSLLQMWKDRPDTLLKCQNLYLYILVDEYQDVNPIQIRIMMDLAELHNNICVVGDPDQTIYSWRGARAETMTKFERMYKEVTSIALTKNYRNPPAVLRSAEKLISHNTGRLKKPLIPTIQNNKEITLWESDSKMRQTEVLYHVLEKLLGSHSEMHMADILDINMDSGFKKFGDIAILYRTQSQGKYLYEQLMKRGYPCQMSAPDSFWEKKEIVDFLEGVQSLIEWTDINAVKDKFSVWMSDKINKFIESQHFTKLQISRLQRLIPHTVVFDNLPITEALKRLIDESRTVQDADNLVECDKINLLTLHAAKGLEFPVVMIFGLEEGSIPYKTLKDDAYWLAEERRLLYVGMTRASEELHLFSAKKDDFKNLEPSRFLKEIGHENLMPGVMPEVKIRQIHRHEIRKAQMKLF